MVPKKKRFVVALGRKPDIERQAYADYKNGRAPQLSAKSFQNLTGVRNTSEGIFLDSSRMRGDLFAGFSMMGFVVNHPKAVWRVSAERIAVIKKLNSLGFKIAVPKYYFSTPQITARVKGHAKVFKAKAKEMGKINGTPAVDPAALWSRDLWIKHGGKRYKPSKALFAPDAFGEGGQVVPIGEKQMVASSALRNSLTVKKLSAQGVSFFFVKDGWQEMHNLSKLAGKKVFRNIDHPDLFVGRAGNVMLVDEAFLKENHGILSLAAKQSGAKIIQVPKEESSIYPANFLVLGENRVMVDKDAKKTIELLRHHGVEVVPTPVSLRANRAAGGGVRCFVNEL